jgi:hypothetical protein
VVLPLPYELALSTHRRRSERSTGRSIAGKLTVDRLEFYSVDIDPALTCEQPESGPSAEYAVGAVTQWALERLSVTSTVLGGSQ